jgi:hypothetical protein
MKKTYIIIGGVVTVLLLLVIWLYLLIYGTPKPVENFFTDFSFSVNTENTPVLPSLPINPATVDIETAQLRQLTTKAVIGFREVVNTSDNTRLMYYAEAGTGHVYAINLITGEEKRVSNTTIPQADKATFSSDGRYMAVRAGYTNASRISLVNLSEPNSITTEVLDARMLDYTFGVQNELLYTEYRGNGLVGRTLNPETKSASDVFTVPFKDATIVWSNDSATPHYVYPKASSKLAGYLYSLRGGTVVRQNAAGAGLTAIANRDYYVTTAIQGQEPGSYATEISSKNRRPIPIVADPNKCVFSPTDVDLLYCGSEEDVHDYNFPDNWYQGTVSFSDNLHEIDIRTGISAQLAKPAEDVGRPIDVTDMTISDNGRVLYFTNKTDNTLWMYEI